MFNAFFPLCLLGIHKWRWQRGSNYDDCVRCKSTRFHEVGTPSVQSGKL